MLRGGPARRSARLRRRGRRAGSTACGATGSLDRVMYGASELGDWSLIWHLVGLGQALLPGRDPMSRGPAVGHPRRRVGRS